VSLTTLNNNSDNKWSSNLKKATSQPHMDSSPYALQWDAPYPSELLLPIGISELLIRWFLGSTLVHNPNGISVSSAVVAGLSIVTD